MKRDEKKLLNGRENGNNEEQLKTTDDGGCEGGDTQQTNEMEQ